MTAWEYVVGAIIIVLSLIVIGVVLLQEGQQSGMGAISGGDSFMDKGKTRTLDAFLAKWTKVLAIVFFVAVFAGMLVTKFLGAE